MNSINSHQSLCQDLGADHKKETSFPPITYMNSHFLRIWEQIINKSVDNLKKTEIELLIEEQKIQKEKLANIESTLKSIEISLSNINK